MQTIGRTTLLLAAMFLALTATGCPNKQQGGGKVSPSDQGGGNIGPGPQEAGGNTGPGGTASTKQIEWEQKLRLVAAELEKAQSTGNPLVIKDARKKYDDFFAATLKSGMSIDGWVGILNDLQESEAYFRETRGGKVVSLPPQTCLMGTVCLNDFNESRSWPALRVTTADPVTKSVVKGLDGEFRILRPGGLVRVWGKIQVPGDFLNDASSVVATVTVSKIAPFDHLTPRQPTLTLIKKAEDTVVKLRVANKELGKQWKPGPNEYSLDDDEVDLGQYRLYIGIAAKYPKYRDAVLSFNKFTPVDRVPKHDAFGKVVGYERGLDELATTLLAATKTRLETARFLNKQKEHEDVGALKQKLAEALSEAEQQVKNLELIKHHLRTASRDPSVAKISYRELPPEVRKEVDRDKFAFIPFPPSDRRTRPNPVPHEDAPKKR